MAKKPSQTRYYSPPTPCPTEPPDASNGWWLYLSPQWHAHIQGLVKLLENRQLWEGTEAEIDDTIGWVQDIEVGSIKVSEMVLDVRTNAGRLEKLVGGVWIDAGAIDDFNVSAHTLPSGSEATADFAGGNIDFGIPEGAQGEAGIQGIQGEPGIDGLDGMDGLDGSSAGLWEPPPVTDTDKYCSAATALAYTWSDSIQDIMENIDAIETTTAEAIENALGAIGGFLPIGVPTAESIVEFLHEGVTAVVIDWVRVNCSDQDAIRLARDQMYCAMIASGDLENFWGDVDWLAALPPFDFTVDSVSGAWDNFGDWLDYLYSVFDGEIVGWLILAYARFMSATVDEVLRYEDSSKYIAAYAANTAFARETEDCGSAPCSDWEHVFEFENSLDGFISIDTGDSDRYTLQPTYLEHATFKVGGGSLNYRALGTIELTFDLTQLTEVSVQYQQARGGSVPLNTTNQFLQVGGEKVQLTDTGGIGTRSWGGLNFVTTIRYLQYVSTWVDGGSPSGLARLHTMTIKGKGVNPFE